MRFAFSSLFSSRTQRPKLEIDEKEIPAMSHGLLGGMFERRNAATPPEVGGTFEAVEVVPDQAVDRSFEYALDALPCNAMFCDRDLMLRYLNKSSRKTLLTLQQYLPVPVDQMVGKAIHIFHKSRDNIDRILGAQHHEAHHLPYKAVIALGPVKLDLHVEPMMSEFGDYVGAVAMWGISAQQTIDALRKAQEAQRNDIEHLNGNLQMVAMSLSPASRRSPEMRRIWHEQPRIRGSPVRRAGIRSSACRHPAAAWPRWRNSLLQLPHRPACSH